jgi:hypothetical protein
MEKWAWGLGVVVLTGVPAIVGGGIIWQIFEKWKPVIIWEAILLLFMIVVIVIGNRSRSGHGV